MLLPKFTSNAFLQGGIDFVVANRESCGYEAHQNSTKDKSNLIFTARISRDDVKRITQRVDRMFDVERKFVDY